MYFWYEFKLTSRIYDKVYIDLKESTFEGTQMIKAILFDFWGTLVENGTKSPIKQIKSILRIGGPFPEYVLRMERAMMTKPFNSLEDAFRSVCTEFDATCTPEIMEQLIGLWNKSWMLARPYPETEEVLQQLQKRYKLILVSNTDSFSITKVLDKFSLQKYFGGTFLSFEMGMIKTDKNFLKDVLTHENLLVEDCVLVGDSLESDVSAARKIGMDAVLIDRRDSREFNPKIKDLYELEGLLLRQ